MEFEISFTDATTEVISGYASRTTEALLQIRTTYNGAYEERWTQFPLVNIKSWRRRD